jgi:membrane protease YdiL (CAAX protease family)
METLRPRTGQYPNESMTPVRLFLLISFAFSWSCFGALYLLGGLSGAPPLGMTVLIMLAMFGPAIAALVCTMKEQTEQRVRSLGLNLPDWKRALLWLPYAWLTPILLAALAVVLTLFVSGSPAADPVARTAASIESVLEESGKPLPMPAETLFLLQMAINLPLGILINTVILTSSEELGWRGWLQPRLAHLGFWPMSFLVGLIWGIWHGPLILMGYNYPGLGWAGAAAMVAFCVLITPYLSLLRERGTGSWGPGAFHGTINAVTGVSFLWLPEVRWPHMGLLGVEGFALLMAGWGLIWLYRVWRPVSSGHQA